MSKELFLDNLDAKTSGTHPRAYHQLELIETYSEHKHIIRLTRWNTFWKCTTGVSFLFGAISLVITTMVIKYSHNPTFVNDLLVTSFMGSWYAPDLQLVPLDMNNHPIHGHHGYSPHMGSSTLTVEKLNKGKPILPIHSHNDYWRRLPFFEAIHLGCHSIEADVWHLPGKEDDLFVGHHKRSLSSFATLQNMYLEPLETLLDTQNAHDVLISSDDSDTDLQRRLGVFDSDPHATLYLVLDVKNNPSEVFALIQRSFDRFYKKGYLTTFNTSSNSWNHGPVTLVISGAFPLDEIRQQEIRTMFIDAPLQKIIAGGEDADDYYDFDAIKGLSIFASSSLRQLTGSKGIRLNGGLSKDESVKLSNAIEVAHGKGLQIRIWDTPSWPIVQRNDVWKDLLNLGVDLINADDLRGAAEL